MYGISFKSGRRGIAWTTPSMNRTLKGLRVLNTRPKDQAHALSETIRAAGGVVVECPTLQIESTGESWLNVLPNLNSVNFALFISPNSVQFCFKILQQKNITLPESIKIIAIGQGSANALTNLGIDVCTIPEHPDSEHVLAIPSLQRISKQTVLLFKGEGGRTVIEQGLKQRGADVINLCVYKRIVPEVPKQLLKSIWHNNLVDIILITSEQSLHNLFALFGEDARSWLQSKVCLVLSDRLAKTAQSFGIKKIIISRPETIMNALFDYTKGLIHGQKQ